MSAATMTGTPAGLAPALTVTDHAPRSGARSLVTSWDGSPRPSGYGDGDIVRPAVELTITHDKARKAYTVTLYAVEHIQRDGYALTRMTVNLLCPSAGAVRLATIPAARVSVKALATLRDEWREHLSAALAGSPGLVSADVAAWVRSVTA